MPARFLLLLLPALLVSGCGGGGGSGQASAITGAFFLETVNLPAGAVWPLNGVIELRFNHAVDPDSIGFGSIRIRPLQTSIPPVTGRFEFDATEPRVIRFRPACPTDSAWSNGGLQPGGIAYELSLPTHASFGASVLRDRSGSPLSRGTSRRFRTPIPPGEALFLDTVPGPPQVVSVDFPSGLNLYSDPDPTIAITFDQSIDARTTNLHPGRIYIEYSEESFSSGLPLSFPTHNRLPGKLVLIENCGEQGALVYFQITGVLPPDRALRLVVRRQFADLSGETNTSDRIWTPHHRTPTLGEIYRDPSWNEEEETLDQFRDSYDTPVHLDFEAGLGLPLAEFEDGRVRAAFDYPGQFVSEEANFYLDHLTYQEVLTGSTTILTDSNNRSFTVNSGVLNVHDFTIRAGSTLRGRGPNPLVIYATGDVCIEGRLDVSGHHSRWPTSLNSPQFPEGGAAGECGGGRGGTGSIETQKETLRGEAGDGPFGLRYQGGLGGEGCYQQSNNGGATLEFILAGGGGGGGFALTPNQSIVWDRWIGNEKPSFENAGPDVQDVGGFYPPSQVFGGEPGRRGTSKNSGQTNPNMPHGAHGMEDQGQDDEATENPGWNPSGDMFRPGHPTKGPDFGLPGTSIFKADGDTRDDFWGRRLNTDGTVTEGELLIPWAGSGGGAGGDAQLIRRRDVDNDGTLEPLDDFWPVENFPKGAGAPYRKGPAGGGGGGQLLIMAIGTVKIGAEAVLTASGGIGHGGEAIISPQSQVSGSGGGSGGHVVISTSHRLDLREIDLGMATTAPEVASLMPTDNLRAIGGRRGWCASTLDRSGKGNGDFMVGRGGAGANGVIQVHVPNPGRNVLWHADAALGIEDFIYDGDPLNNSLDVDKLEEVFDLVTAPRAYSLIPFFAAQSQVQSGWIDTGLAGLRQPAAGTGAYPDWASPLGSFRGIETTGPDAGRVETEGESVRSLAPIATGPIEDTDFQAYAVCLERASQSFQATFLRNPALLIGFEVIPNVRAGNSFEIVAGEYSRALDELWLTTATNDGPMTLVVQPTEVWEVRPKYFQLSTTARKDHLPVTASVRFEFQAAHESAPGTHEPGTPVPGPTTWSSDLSLLRGMRFLRYRVTFDIDALGLGADLSSERPELEATTLPFAW